VLLLVNDDGKVAAFVAATAVAIVVVAVVKRNMYCHVLQQKH